MKKSKLLKRGIIIFCALLITVFSFGWFTFQKAEAGMQNVELLTNTFLAKTSRGEYENTYSMMAEVARREISYGQFKDSLTYPKGIFTEITTVRVTSYSFMYYIGQGMTINFTGYVVYSDGNTGDLTATYIEENGEWKITSMRIFPNIDRLKKFNTNLDYTPAQQN